MNTEFHEYSKYIEHSELLKHYYLNRSVLFQNQLFPQIDALVAADINDFNNKPMLLEGGPLEGKKTLLTQWAKHHQSLHVRKQSMQKQDILIVQYASSGFKYSQIIYRTLAQLRETLDISQKVEIHQEKLRKYFPYWMEICSKTLSKQALEQGKSPSRKIILVFPSINLLTNSKNEPLLPGFWLPETFPFNVRVILSVANNSLAAEFLRTLKLPSLKLPSYNNLRQHFINEAAGFTREWLIHNQSHLDLLYLRCFNSLFQLDHRFNFTIRQFNLANLKELSLSQLLYETITFWAQRQIKRSLVESLLIVLSLSKKGLTAGEICHLTKMKPSEFKRIMGAFSGLLECYQDMWYIPDHRLKEAISDMTGLERSDTSQLHMQMALGLREFPSSLRKLEEQTYHLVVSNSLPQLKETISQVENFLLLFNWHTKYELCHYWQLLQMKHAFDPVFEYNRSVTAYEMHSYPTEQNLFNLILQLSRFFIEYAHFEMYDTPNFRHPQIKGDQDLLAELHICQEFKAMGMLMNRQLRYSQKPKKKLTKRQNDPATLRASISNKTFDEMNKHNTILIENKIQRVMRDIENKKPVKLNDHKHEKTDRYVYKTEFREWVETISIEIPGNRQKFIEYYMKQLEEYFDENHLNWQHESDDDQDEVKFEISKSMNLNAILDAVSPYSQYEQEKYHLNFTEPKNYYYKQWLWVQFPWISLSLDHDYSRLIRKCIKSSTEYISVKQERDLTHKAFLIALQSRRRKKIHHRMAQKIIRKRPHQNSAMCQSSDSRSYVVSKPNTSRQYPRLNISKELDSYCRQNNTPLQSPNTRGLNNDATFLTGVAHQSIMEPLPTIRTSRTHRDSRNDELELKRQLNIFVYENAKLEKKIIQLKQKEETCQNTNDDRQHEGLFDQVRKKQAKADQVKYQLAKALIQQQKLKIILDICKQNTIYNTECVTPLNTFVYNLKSMIDQAKAENKRLKDKAKVVERETKQRIKNLIDEIMNQNEERRRPIMTANRLPTLRDLGRDTTKSVFPKKAIEHKGDDQRQLSNHDNSTVLLKVENFQSQFGELTLNNPRILQYCEVVDRKRHLKSRIIQLQLQRETLQKRIGQPLAQKDINAVNEPQYQRRRATLNLSRQHDLKEHLQVLKQKKAGLLMFLETVTTRRQEMNIQRA